METTAYIIAYNLRHLRQVVFEVTDACNLQCEYCAYSDLYEGYDKRENLKLPFRQAQLIIDYLYQYWSQRIPKGTNHPVTISFYGGEPTLNVALIKQVIDYVESLPPIGRLFNYSMTTNAMLLDKYMDFLVEKDFHLLISLDGDKRGQDYRKDKQGKNSFDQVIRNIDILRAKYPNYFETNVMFNSVIHNKNGVESAYRFIEDYFGKKTKLSSLSTAGIREDKKKEFNETYRNLADSIREATDCEALENKLFIDNPLTYGVLDYIHKWSGNVYGNYSQLLFDKDNFPIHPTGTCIPFHKKMFITVKGKILQCEKISHEYTLGTVNDEKVDLNPDTVAKLHNKYVFRYINQCKKCAIKEHCNLCALEYGNIHDLDTKCPYCRTLQEKTKQDSQQLEYLSKYPELYRKLLKEVVIR